MLTLSDHEPLGQIQEHYGRRIFLGIMYAKLGMRDKALEQAQRALASTPNRPWILFFICKLRAILGDRREAIGYLRQAIAEGFLTLELLDYHRRPHMGLHSLAGEEDRSAPGAALTTCRGAHERLSAGQSFPLDALQAVNSPLDVLVNGKSAQVISAIGRPGLSDKETMSTASVVAAAFCST